MMRKTMMCFMALFLLMGFSGCGTKPENEKVREETQEVTQTHEPRVSLQTDKTELINNNYLQLPLFQASMKNGKFQTTDTDVRITVLRYACKTGETTIGSNWINCKELQPEEVLGKESVFDWKELLETAENFEYGIDDKTKSMDTCKMAGKTTKESVKQIFDQLICKAQIPSYFRVTNVKEEDSICGSNRVILSCNAEGIEYTIGMEGYDESGVWVTIDFRKPNENETKAKMYAFFEGMTIQDVMEAIQK